jgi:predicted ester cyclase
MAGGAVQGRRAADEVNRAFIAGFPDVSFTRDALMVDGDRVVWIGEVRDTDTGGFMGLAATGKPFRLTEDLRLQRDADSDRPAEGQAALRLQRTALK